MQEEEERKRQEEKARLEQEEAERMRLAEELGSAPISKGKPKGKTAKNKKKNKKKKKDNKKKMKTSGGAGSDQPVSEKDDEPSLPSSPPVFVLKEATAEDLSQ